MKKNFSVMLAVIFCALLVQAQDTPPDANWESDPLDVLEPQSTGETPEPTMPEFQEIPESGHVESTPPPEPEIPAAPEIDAPAPTPSVAESIPEPTAPDSPDANRESEFHRIYKTYNQEPTSVESWEKALGSRNSEVYKVQKGDTLSGISETLFGDQFFWPKVWSLNSDKILNPHEINPGLGVQFFPGSMEDAPTLAVGNLADASAVQGQGGPALPQGALDGAQIPPAKKKTPLLKNIPGSLPQYRLGTVEKPKDQIDLELMEHKFPKAYEYLEYFVADDTVEGVGVVTGAEMDLSSVGDYQFLYVRLTNGGGKNFVVQRNLTKVEDPRHKERKAQMVEIQGEIEVLEKVNEGENIYRAIVKKSIHPIEVGSVLVPGNLPMIDPALGSSISGIGATIMGGQFEKKRAVMGSNSFVFLDAGTSQGMQVGQTMTIYADEKLRSKRSGAISNDRAIGTLKVVQASNNFATAYVVKATDDIRVGDYVGKVSSTAFNSAAPVVEEKAPSVEDEFNDFESAPDVPSSSSDEILPDGGSEDSDLEF